MCSTTIFWWWQPIPAPDQSSSTRPRDDPCWRKARAANALARNGPIAIPGTDPLNTAAVGSTRTSTPRAAFSASRSVSGRSPSSPGMRPVRSMSGSICRPVANTVSPGPARSSRASTCAKYSSPSMTGTHSVSSANVGLCSVAGTR